MNLSSEDDIMNLLSGADFNINTGARIGHKLTPEMKASANALHKRFNAANGGHGLMNLRTQDQMLQRHHPDIYKQFKAGVPVETL